MDRRTFLRGVGALPLLPSHSFAQGVQRASVERPGVVKQECAAWCWAAASSMIFENLGHVVDQKSIVTRVYGGQYCTTAPTIAITSVLNVPWIDDNGDTFRPHIQAGYDQFRGIVNINNSFIVDELRSGRLLLYANTHHCMVIAEADYIMTPMGPNIINVLVLDPWPGSEDEHALTPPELHPAFAGGQMTYLAAVRL